MSSKLPPECLQMIFKLFEDDLKSLHSCLLVDRYWCDCVVSTLWRRPFELVSRPSSGKLIETYTHFFDEESKKLLSPHNIIIKPEPIVFDYPFFIRSIQYHNVYDFSSVWLHEADCQGQQKLSSSDDRTNLLRAFSKELIKLFLKYNAVKDLSFNVIRFLDVPYLPDNLKIHNFRPPTVPLRDNRVKEYLSPFHYDILAIIRDSKPFLTNLQRLEIGVNESDANIMKLLGSSTKNLKTLEFRFSSESTDHPFDFEPNIDYMMHRLIRNQKCIKKVVICQGTLHTPTIILSLGCHVKTLTELTFDKVNFDFIRSAHLIFETISSCCKLEKLAITNCPGLTKEVISPLNNANFGHLNTFTFIKFYDPMDDIRSILTRTPQMGDQMEPLASLISGTNHNLQVLRIGLSSIHGRRLPLNFSGTTFPTERIMDVLSLSCPNLSLLEIHIRRITFPQVLNLLNSTNQLSRLIFSAESDLTNDEDFWRRLSMHIPTSLQDLTININLVFFLVTLHRLFERLQCNLEILQFPMSTFINDEYLCIIVQYANRMGTMKRLVLPNDNKVTSRGLSNALQVIEEITYIGENE
ncbi:11599_t:CDS:1 [Funneliformis mosseae]|uniref:11599_t:CDS:1 n=1 Tax=Funneliformis mosseae TaxID=27381 RepID=A0A9N9BK90_FUNMO|nr:11599_t:CDS:1 [Funneliformis mosseae]